MIESANSVSSSGITTMIHFFLYALAFTSFLVSNAMPTLHFTPYISYYESAQSHEPFAQARPDYFSDISHDTSVYNAREMVQENQNYEAHTNFQDSRETKQVTHLYPVDQLTQAVAENSDLLAVYQTQKFGNPSRIEIRVEKMEQIAQGIIVYTHQQYELTSDAIGLLYQEGLNPDLYQECSGNQLQQHIHQECINIVEQLALPNLDILI